MGPLGPSWGPLGPERVTREDAGSPRAHAGSPRRFCNLGSGPLNDSSGLRTEAQGRVRGPENTPIRASRHGGGYIYNMDEYQVPSPGAPAHPRNIRVTPVSPPPGPPRGLPEASPVRHDGPRSVQNGPRNSQEAYKRAPRRSRWPPDLPRRPQDAPRGLQETPRELQETSREGPERPKSSIFIGFYDVFGLLAFSSFRRSKTAQEPPKTAPRRPKRLLGGSFQDS